MTGDWMTAELAVIGFAVRRIVVPYKPNLIIFKTNFIDNEWVKIPLEAGDFAAGSLRRFPLA